jgi:hypothetical protein
MNYTKEIKYDRDTKDFAMKLNGEIFGYARTYLQAEVTLDKVVYNLLTMEAAVVAEDIDVTEEQAAGVLEFMRNEFHIKKAA